jgi:hypothetical protein
MTNCFRRRSGIDNHGALMICLHAGGNLASVKTGFGLLGGGCSVDSLNQKSTLKPRFVALFALGRHDIPCLHDLSSDARFALLEDQEDRRSEPVAIDPQVYFPLHFEDSVIQIDKALADKSRSFFDRYVGARVIEVHRDHRENTGRPRHHAIHLATERCQLR